MSIRRWLGWSGPRDAAEAEARRLVEQGRTLEAGRLLENNGLDERAADLYMAAGEYRAAAEVLVRMGRRDEALDAVKRSEKALAAGPSPSTPAGRPRALQEAGESLQRGQTYEAARRFAAAGEWLRAAELYARAGYLQRSAEAFEQAGEWARAAEGYERLALEGGAAAASAPGSAPTDPAGREAARRAGRLFARCGAHERALQVLTRAGLFSDAAEMAAEAGRPAQAAELYTRADRLEQAADGWERAGDSTRASLVRAELALRRDLPAEAAGHFLAGGDPCRAAELYEGLGRPADAGAAYESGGALAEAAEAYLRAGQRERAAVAFERAGLLARAAEQHDALGDEAQAARLYEQAGDHLRSGKAAVRQGDTRRAIALLQRVAPHDEGHAEAAELLAQLFVETGLPRLALQRAQMALGDAPVAPHNLGLAYWLGVAREALHEHQTALDVYQKILALGFGYRDVSERARRLAARPASAATRPAPAVAPAPAPTQHPLGPDTAVGPAPAAAPPAATAGSTAAAGSARTRVRPAGVDPTMRETAPAAEERYVTREVLGRGALGTVYLADDRQDGRSVALRVFPAEVRSDPALRGLLSDLPAATRLSHPNLVKAIAMVEHRGQPALVSELVRGTNMESFVRSGQTLSLKRCHALGRALALVLSFVHRKGLAHGSVRPSNLYVVSGILKLSDVGRGPLARASVPPNPYRAPENHLDVAGDIYALGAVLYHLLTGRVPSQALGAAVPAPSRLVSGVPESFERLLLRALDPRPEARFHSTKDVVQALDAMVTIG